MRGQYTPSTDNLCEYCGERMGPGKPPNARFCSTQHRRMAYNVARGNDVDAPAIPHNTKGMIAELMVAADLLKRGYHVFHSVSQSAPCDMLSYKTPDRIIRIEVRSAYRTVEGQISPKILPKDSGRYDAYAFVASDGEILYYPDFTAD